MRLTCPAAKTAERPTQDAPAAPFTTQDVNPGGFYPRCRVDYLPISLQCDLLVASRFALPCG